MSKWYWHIHHDVLLEESEDIEERINYIRNDKPICEIKTRLRLLREVVGKLPPEFVKVARAYHEARRVCNTIRKAGAWTEYSPTAARAYKALLKAGYLYDEARREPNAEITALHAQECPGCPWDGETIFPKRS